MNHRQLAVLSSETGAVPTEYVREIISPVSEVAELGAAFRAWFAI